jgi:hypothetical protein
MKMTREWTPNQRHGVDAGGAFCLQTKRHQPGTTHAERSVYEHES